MLTDKIKQRIFSEELNHFWIIIKRERRYNYHERYLFSMLSPTILFTIPYAQTNEIPLFMYDHLNNFLLLFLWYKILGWRGYKWKNSSSEESYYETVVS